MARPPRGSDLYQMGLSKGYDKGAELERERIMTLLRRYRDANDEVLEGAAWWALDEAIRGIEERRHVPHR